MVEHLPAPDLHSMKGIDMEATKTVPPDDAGATADRIQVPADLARLALEATWEIAALTQAIVEHYGQLRDEDQRPLVVRGMALRVHDLNNRVMSILDEPEELAGGSDARELQRVILGEAAAGIGEVE